MEDQFPTIRQEVDLDWAQAQFRGLADGQYAFKDVCEMSEELKRTALMLATQFHIKPKRKTLFRGTNGAQLLDSRRTRRHSAAIETVSNKLIFIV